MNNAAYPFHCLPVTRLVDVSVFAQSDIEQSVAKELDEQEQEQQREHMQRVDANTKNKIFALTTEIEFVISSVVFFFSPCSCSSLYL